MSAGKQLEAHLKTLQSSRKLLFSSIAPETDWAREIDLQNEDGTEILRHVAKAPDQTEVIRSLP